MYGQQPPTELTANNATAADKNTGIQNVPDVTYVCYIIFSVHGLLPGHIYPCEHLQPNKYTVNQVQPQAASNKPSLSKMCSRTLED